MPLPVVYTDDWGDNADQVAAWLLRRFDEPDYQPPVLPDVATRLWRLTQDPNVPFSAVIQVLQEDSMLTTSLMRLATSPVYGAGIHLTSLEEVVARLGLNRVRELFMQVSVAERVFNAPGYKPAMVLLRHHSVTTGYIARMLAVVVGADVGQAFLGGLLHDVGICAGLVALSERVPRAFRPKLDVTWPALVRHHSALARRLFTIWGLDSELAVIAHHHTVDAENGPQISTLVALADALANEIGVGVPGEFETDVTDAARRALGIDRHTLAELMHQAELFASVGDL